MSLEKRIRLLSFTLVIFTMAEVLLALISLLEGHSLTRVALIYGTQLLMFGGSIASSRVRLKKDLRQQRSAA